MKNYKDFVKTIFQSFQDAEKLPLKSVESVFDICIAKNTNELANKNVLVFAPHPDDECIIGLLPLRLMLEANAKITDVAITLGSNLQRRQGRLQELTQACKFLNWDIRVCGKEGFENIRLKTREDNPSYWNECVDELVSIIKETQPAIIFMPHIDDWNATHIGTSKLVSDAVEKSCFSGAVINTEYWGGIKVANLMIEATEEHIAVLMEAVARHVKEVERNDYHLRLPFWMGDNVRRGAELVGGQGAEAPRFKFATLYNLQFFKDGIWQQPYKSRFVSVDENVANILKI